MKFYHGTIDKFVPKILQEGLKPVPDNRWNAVKLNPFYQAFGLDPYAMGYNPSKDDEPGYVYFTPALDSAYIYAESKAAYYKTVPGESFIFGYGGEINFKKLKNAPTIPDARAAILVLHIPESKSFPVLVDYNSSGNRLYGSIPPEYISLLERPVPNKFVRAYQRAMSL